MQIISSVDLIHSILLTTRTFCFLLLFLLNYQSFPFFLKFSSFCTSLSFTKNLRGEKLVVLGPCLTLRCSVGLTQWFTKCSQHLEIFLVRMFLITNSVFKRDTGLFKFSFVLTSVFVSSVFFSEFVNFISVVEHTVIKSFTTFSNYIINIFRFYSDIVQILLIFGFSLFLSQSYWKFTNFINFWF